MADDQLSWESLFNGRPSERPAEEPVPAKTTDQSANPAAGSEPVLERAPALKAAPSSWDWAPLKFDTPTPTPAPQESVRLKVSPLQAPPPPLESWRATAGVPAVASSPSPRTRSRSVPRAFSSPSASANAGDLASADDAAEVLTVSELNRGIKDTLEGKFPLLWLKGEISNFKAHTSGHFYFSLKDSKAQISAVMFKGFNAGLRFRPEDGMEVIVRGKVTVYEPRGNYQIFCESMEPVGAGALQKAFEQLKAKLQAEGLFDQDRKRPLPALPKHVAIVTSPTGAAIRDMLNVLGRRFKGLRITLIPAKVQGDAAPAEVVAGIEAACRLEDVDVLIVGRGGGSIEDLWAFNDERVARAIAASRVPTISAVGHEIDFTIADFVADLRAPTPSAAAELVVKNAADIANQVARMARALELGFARRIAMLRAQGESLARRLVDPQRRLQDMALRCDELAQRLEAGVGRGIEARRMRLALLRQRLGSPLSVIGARAANIDALSARLRTGARHALDLKRREWARQSGLLHSLSPLKVVERGYSIVTVQEKVVTGVDQLAPGTEFRVQFARGAISASVTRVESTEGPQSERNPSGL